MRSALATNFWSDNWLPCGPLIDHTLWEVSHELKRLHVRAFWESSIGWKQDNITQFLPKNILNTLNVRFLSEDFFDHDDFVWVHSQIGSYTVKFAYWMLAGHDNMQVSLVS